MNYRISAAVFCFMLSFSVIAQKNIKPGYIINEQGDTIKGFIDYRDWEVNPKSIVFGTSDSTVKTTYTAHTINGFGVEGNIYTKKIIQTNISPYKTENLNFVAQIIYNTDTVFVKALLLGKKSLYSYYDRYGRDNFYIPNDNGLDLLIFQRYLKKINDQQATNIIVTNNRYIGQLMLYFSDCPSLKTKIEKTEYSRLSLIDIFNAYYKCAGITSTYKEPEFINVDEAGIFAGMSLTKLFFAGGAAPYLADSKFPTSAAFTIGAFYNHVFSKNLAKWALNNELQYSSYKTDGVYNVFKNSHEYTVTYCKFRFNYLKLNTMIRFTSTIKEALCYVEAGMSNGYVIGMENYKKVESVMYSTTDIQEGKAIDDPRKYEQSWLVSFGAKYQRFSLCYRFEKGNGMSNYSWLKSDAIRQYFLFYYNLR